MSIVEQVVYRLYISAGVVRCSSVLLVECVFTLAELAAIRRHQTSIYDVLVLTLEFTVLRLWFCRYAESF